MCLSQRSVAARRYQDHSNSYKENHLTEVVAHSFGGLVHHLMVGSTAACSMQTDMAIERNVTLYLAGAVETSNPTPQ